MAKKVTSLSPEVRGQEELSPFATRLVDSQQAPALGQNQVTFWGDSRSGKCGILMRVGNRTFRFFGTEVASTGSSGQASSTPDADPPYATPSQLSGFVKTAPATLEENRITAQGVKGLVIDSNGSEYIQEWQLDRATVLAVAANGVLFCLRGLDAGGAPVTNIPWPRNPYDAVNLDYLTSQFIEVVTALPTPSSDYDRRQVCLRVTGYPDTVYRCLQCSDGTWDWAVSEGASF